MMATYRYFVQFMTGRRHEGFIFRWNIPSALEKAQQRKKHLDEKKLLVDDYISWGRLALS